MPSRRHFLSTATLATCGFVLSACAGRATRPAPWQSFPFTLGVASGVPSSDGFVLWTRLAPEPLSADPDLPGGLHAGDLLLEFEISSDASMRRIVRTGTAVAVAQHAHSVHLQVHGLQPGRPYWYRFRSGDAHSAIGHALTLPHAGARLQQLHLGLVSCSNYEQGYFSAYRHLANEHPDYVMYLGDYIYEYVDKVSTDLVRTHSDGVESTDLRTYRNRYAQYRLDADLQQLHAASTALVTWDDHEVTNDYAGLLSASHGKPAVFGKQAEFKLRRAAAYQAFYEHMPVTPARLPHDAQLRIYDRYAFGDLLQVFMTDTRQYRSAAPCFGPPDGVGGRIITADACAERNNAARSMFGRTQEQWLQDGLSHSSARWNVIGQSALMAQLRQPNQRGEPSFWTDDWNGFPASRQRLLQHLHDAQVRNPIVVGGDAHAFFANDLKLDFDDQTAPTIATEFVGTSISSKPGPNFTALLPDNPHIRFFDNRQRGYISMRLQHANLLTRLQGISDARDPGATMQTLKEFVVEDGHAGVLAS